MVISYLRPELAEQALSQSTYVSIAVDEGVTDLFVGGDIAFTPVFFIALSI